MIVDGHVHVFPSAVADVLVAIPMNAMPDTAKTAQFLDIQMQQISRAGVFVAAGRRKRVEVAQTADAQALQDAADGGRAEFRFSRNAAAAPALTTQSFHLRNQNRRGGPTEMMRTGAVIPQPGRSFLAITAHPFGGGARTDLERGGRRVPCTPLMNDTFHQRLSTMQRKSGILMDVHSASRKDEIASPQSASPVRVEWTTC